MLKIEDNEIKLTRGDSCTISFKISINEDGTQFYQFKKDDEITFGVYNRKGMDKEALILKSKKITEPTEECKIELTSEDTKIGSLINKEKEYWYEVILNNSETILGYDEDGAKKFILYPEGSNIK